MRIIDCEQGTDDWLWAKLGVVSASDFGDVLCKGEGRKKYMRKLAAEYLRRDRDTSFSSPAMQRGIELEPRACAEYERLMGVTVRQVGFILRDDGWVGCSPDRLVGDEGLLEVKCPYGSTQIYYLEREKLPSVYKPQVHGQMLITGRKWCDFFSYCPGMKSFRLRVERDEEYIAKLNRELDKFVKELQDMIDKHSTSEF